MLPWMPKVARDLLVVEVTFTALLPAARLVLDRAPADVTTAFAVIQCPGTVPLSGDGVAWSPLVQVDAYCPDSTPGAAQTVWDIAAAAATVLGRARNQTYESITYSSRLVDGPIPDRDTSRGTSAVLCRALIRAEFTVHSR